MRIRTILLIAILLLGGLALYSFCEARRMPVVREATIELPDWPKGAKPVTAVLIADIHAGDVVMTTARLDEIIDRINGLHPDLVLIAGDLVYGHDPAMAAKIGPGLSRSLARLKPVLGTVAVLGNHDFPAGRSPVRTISERAGITVLQNQAVERGPIAIAGIGDAFSRQQNVAATWAQLGALKGAHIAMTHSPKIAPELPPDTNLLLAGHTHCGQVKLPFYGPIAQSPVDRNLCGFYTVGKRKVIVTAGLGTSEIPFRLNAPPDLWLLHLGPAH